MAWLLPYTSLMKCHAFGLQVLAMSKVIPNSGASILRGVVDLADVTNATIYAEVPMSGLSVTMTVRLAPPHKPLLISSPLLSNF